MTRRSWGRFSRLPIKWKLTIASAFMIFVSFAAINTVQYFVVQNWMVKEQKESMSRDMNEALNYFIERESAFRPEELAAIRNYLNKTNAEHQLIRVLDDQGRTLIAVTDDLPELYWLEPAASGYTQGVERVRHAGGSLLVMRSPLTIFDFNGTVEMIRSVDDFDRLVGAVFRVMIAFGLGAIVVSAVVGWLLSRRFLKTLQAMADTIRSIKHDGMQARMQPQGSRDELSVLMLLFNDMMDEVERALEQQSRFVEDASHELRTPIAIIEGHLKLLRRWGKQDPAVLDESLAAATEELLRLKRLVEELLALTRVEKAAAADGTGDEAAAEEVVRSLIGKLAVVYPESVFHVRPGPGAERLSVAMPEAQLGQVLLILLDNAVKHSASGEAVTVALEQKGSEASIAVADQGAGIPAADLPHVTERFYRADKSRGGTSRGYGLGLAIAKRIVEGRGGTIAIESREGRGTTVLIRLPARER